LIAWRAEDELDGGDMRRNLILLLIGIVCAIAVGSMVISQRRSWAPGANRDWSGEPLAATADEKKILTELQRVASRGETYLSVPARDGRMLRVLAESAGAKQVVEIGTSTGYSGLWFCLALQRTGGRLTTFEIDHGRAMEARQHFQEAGVSDLVTVVEGDAHEQIGQLQGPIDLVFIDADKEGYVDYLNKLLPLLRPGGLIVAHNIDMVPEYVRAVNGNPKLETVFYMEGGGMGITLKKM
jgi:predicted O-methyltransferase YrrM